MSPTDLLLWGLRLLGGAAVLLGLWALGTVRRGPRDPEPADDDAPADRQPARTPASPATRTVFGLVLAALGYHAIVYSVPPSQRLLAVPLDRAWILIAVCVAAVAGSLLADRREARRNEPG